MKMTRAIIASAALAVAACSGDNGRAAVSMIDVMTEAINEAANCEEAGFTATRQSDRAISVASWIALRAGEMTLDELGRVEDAAIRYMAAMSNAGNICPDTMAVLQGQAGAELLLTTVRGFRQ